MIQSSNGNAVWVKSSLCANGDCVEVALIGEQVLVRESKNPSSPVLRFELNEWMAFLSGVRRGEFDPS
jgi:hypothetical protein